jgi:hypothetical protein
VVFDGSEIGLKSQGVRDTPNCPIKKVTERA